MVELRLMGGLGNQMSQVAFASTLALSRGDKLLIDTSSYKSYKIRQCSIYKMCLSDDIIINDNTMSFMHVCHRLSQKLYHLRRYVNKRMNGISDFGEHDYLKYVNKGHYYTFDSACYGYPSSKRKNVDVYGYFLGEPYFRECLPRLKCMFDVKIEYLSEKALNYISLIKSTNHPVAVSLRLQDDYAMNADSRVCSLAYFRRAIERIKTIEPDSSFFVFADDVSRAKILDLGVEPVYIEGVNDVEGMQIIKNCHAFIISNSSFSWWGAYLSDYSDKLVIAPERWMNNKNDHSSKYYDGVIKISVE